MLVYSKRDNQVCRKEFLIPKNGKVTIGDVMLHVIIDNSNVEFTVKKLEITKEIDAEKWEIFDDYTFPSSLLNEFIRTSHDLQFNKGNSN